MVQLNGKDVDPQSITISFYTVDYTFKIEGGCNVYQGKYGIEEATLKVGEISGEEKKCPLRETEKGLLKAIKNNTRCMFTMYTLTLFQGEKETAIFSAVR